MCYFKFDLSTNQRLYTLIWGKAALSVTSTGY